MVKNFTVNFIKKEFPSSKGRKLAVPPYFPPINGRTLLRSVTGPPVFAYSSFSETTPKLPSTSFCSKNLSADGSFSLRIPDVYSSFSLSFTVFILFLYHQILFNFPHFVNPFSLNPSCIQNKKGLSFNLTKVLQILMYLFPVFRISGDI